MPPEYHVTLRSREDDQFRCNDYSKEDWLRFQCEDPNILLFITDSELDAWYGADFIISDGTFDKCPDDAAFKGGQVYTFHTEVNTEPVAVGFALLRRKDRRTYE